MTRQRALRRWMRSLRQRREQCVLAVPLAGGVPLYEQGARAGGRSPRLPSRCSSCWPRWIESAAGKARAGHACGSHSGRHSSWLTGVFVDGPGMHPLEELLVWMIVLSDNTATNVLIGLLGAECIKCGGMQR